MSGGEFLPRALGLIVGGTIKATTLEDFISSVDERAFAGLIDYTVIGVEACTEKVRRAAEEVIGRGFRCLVVSPYHVLRGTLRELRERACLASVVGFPLGYTPTEAKVVEARVLFEHGVDEVDVVMNVQALKCGDVGLAEDDLRAVVEVARSYGGVVKAIAEVGLLSDDEKVKALEVAVRAGAHYIKTSTGVLAGVPGASIHDVALLSRAARGRIKVKASGGIRHALDAVALLLAGADILGASHAAEILREYEKLRRERAL